MPDSRLNLAKLTNNVVNDVLMVMDFVSKTANGEELQSNAYVYGRSLQNDNSIVDGIHFLGAVVNRIDQGRALHGKKGTTFLRPKYEREYITFRWVTRAGQTQLLIDNSQDDARDADVLLYYGSTYTWPLTWDGSASTKANHRARNINWDLIL